MKPVRPKRTRQRARHKVPAISLSSQARASLEAALGHRFKDEELLLRAMTHSSAVSHRKDAVKGSYQRLEFLGDRVLGLVIAERLFLRHTTEREGSLAPRLNRLVNKSSCAEAAAHMGLGQHVIMAENEIEVGGRDRESTLGDVCEAVIGALYLDGGLKAAETFIARAWAPQFSTRAARLKDPKTLLQEWAQASHHELPRYRVRERSGPDHAPRFTIEVSIGEDLTAMGEDGSKQDAERAAALKLLDQVSPADD